MSKHLSGNEVYIICDVNTNEYFITQFTIRMLKFIKLSPRTFYRKCEKSGIFSSRFTHHNFVVTKGTMIQYGESN